VALHVPSGLPLSLKTDWPFSPRRARPSLGQPPLLWCRGKEGKQEAQACCCLSTSDGAMRSKASSCLLPQIQGTKLLIFLGNLYQDREVAGTRGFGQPDLDITADAAVCGGCRGWRGPGKQSPGAVQGVPCGSCRLQPRTAEIRA